MLKSCTVIFIRPHHPLCHRSKRISSSPYATCSLRGIWILRQPPTKQRQQRQKWHNHHKNKNHSYHCTVNTLQLEASTEPVQPLQPSIHPKKEPAANPWIRNKINNKIQQEYQNPKSWNNGSNQQHPKASLSTMQNRQDEDNNKNNNISNYHDVADDDDSVQLTPLQRKRRNVAQFIPQWLRREPAWRKRVMEILNLPTDAESIKNNALLSSNFYGDSIPSFAETLSTGPPESLHAVCDKLIEAGLSSKELAIQYRNLLRSNAKSKEIQNELASETQRLAKHRRRYQTTKKALETLNAELASHNQNDENSKRNIFAKTMESLTSMFQQPFQEQEQPDEDARNSSDNWMQMKMLQETIQRTTEQLAKHQAAIDASESKIGMLQRELTCLSTPLPPDVLHKIESAISAVLPTVCWEYAQHIKSRHSKLLEQYQTLDAKTDLTRPHEWYLHARLDQRTIIYHGGPTNSGKTHAALERLKAAKTGIYYGPLRLLAAEVYEKLTVAGIYCNLITGQEKRIVPFATHGSATVEMAATTAEKTYDVVVIDEIQMIADDERGFAWTRALLGTRCKEIHVCGGLEAVDIVRKIANACNDEFALHTYQRFSELRIAASSLATQCDQAGSYRYVQPGDCVVAFSRNDIFAIQREIERTTNFRCCVVYGSLPPQTRSEQARRFNDPNSGYDILVASDAIGMGLNLNIRRIIFNSIYKNDGRQIIRLGHSAMKQISGRAGRRNSPFPIGEVTTRDPRDMDHLRRCLTTDIEPVDKAGLLYTAMHVETFSEALEKYGLGHGSKKDLHKILKRFNDMASVKSDYFVSKKDDMMIISKHLDSVDLPIADKYLLCMAPVTINSPQSMAVLKRFATKMAAGQVAGLTHSMIPKPAQSFEQLARLCSIFNELELFLWLQYKFPPGNMMEQLTAQQRKEQAMKYISEGLQVTEKLRLTHDYIKRDQFLRAEWKYANAKKGDLHGDEDDDEEGGWY